MLYAKDLNEASLKKEKTKNEVYKLILEDVYKKIQRRNQNNIKMLKTTIPLIKLGYPLYNIQSAVAYVHKKLTKGGFKVLICNNILDISW